MKFYLALGLYFVTATNLLADEIQKNTNPKGSQNDKHFKRASSTLNELTPTTKKGALSIFRALQSQMNYQHSSSNFVLSGDSESLLESVKEHFKHHSKYLLMRLY